MTTAQPIRRSQFITTYGPGAILEGTAGPRVVPSLDESGVFAERQVSDFEVTDQRLSQALLNGSGILRLPSNAEVGQPDNFWIYRTRRFPSWSLCVRRHVSGNAILYQKRRSDLLACPQCRPQTNPSEAWRQASRDAVRFVRACPAGHLDDVHWSGLIRHTTNNCNPSYLRWDGGGGALRHVNIVCPSCQERMNLGLAYARDWPCSGRFPERGSTRSQCDRRSKIIQRGAANLRISEIRSALTIPPRSTPLHRLLEKTVVWSIISTLQPKTKQQLMDALTTLAGSHLLHQSVVTEIGNCSESDILEAVAHTLSGSSATNDRELRLEEFTALRNAAVNGAPARQSTTPGAPPQFEVIHQHVRAIVLPSGWSLRVTPVNRLRVVMAQTGYRRLDPASDLVDIEYYDGQRTWYPGVELFGEGIFIDLAPLNGTDVQYTDLKGQAAAEWFGEWIRQVSSYQQGTSFDPSVMHPAFVWWHTLSHRLINGLSIDSGYSSAAIRERVFVDIDENSGDAKGGVLLYTAQPGGDGTLGGLVALVPQFERIIDIATRDIDACSNDPLCGDETFSPGKYNGSACYTCALVSETSCEHRNMSLDRNLLIQDPP